MISLRDRMKCVAESQPKPVVAANNKTASKSRFKILKKCSTGAEGGTRTPTPLRVHGPEPCASANSATTARCHSPHRKGRSTLTASL